jgi:hypothetical protein
MNKLVGSIIERPPAEPVLQKPEIVEPRHVDISSLIVDRSQLKRAIDELRDSDEIDGAEGQAALADAEQGLAELDQMLPEATKAHADLIDDLDRIDEQFPYHETDKQAAVERAFAMAHAFGVHIDDLDPEVHSETIERGNEFLQFVNPDYKPHKEPHD